jgi:hypothetical protein
MATTIPEGYASLAIEYTSADGTAPFYCTGGIVLPTGGTLTEVADGCFTKWVDAWEEFTFSQFTFERAIITLPAPGGGLGSVESTLPAQPGGADGDPAPIGMAVIVNKRTGLIGRKGRGRFFIPGLLGEGDVDVNGIFSNATVETYNTAAEAWLESMQTPDPPATGATNPQLLHSDASLVPSAVVSLSVSNKIGWLRKRLR